MTTKKTSKTHSSISKEVFDHFINFDSHKKGRVKSLQLNGEVQIGQEEGERTKRP
jgi:hypothetical protein